MKATDFYAGGWFAFFFLASHLQRHNVARRANQGTPQLFCEEIQRWYLKTFTQTINTLSTPRWRDYSHPLQNSLLRPWTLFTCEKVALKSRLSPKCARTAFWSQSWFQRWLDIKVKFHESNKSQGFFISVSESPCSNYPPPIVKEILHKQKPHV